MRGLVQRVRQASVTVDDVVVGSIDRGLCVLVGVTHTDDEVIARRLAEKVWTLRCFPAPGGGPGFEVPVAEVGGAVLVVSQFTLYGDTRRGRRPSWVAAARPEQAAPLVEAFGAHLRTLGATVETGRFGADMQVAIHNDGPVTLMLEVEATGSGFAG